MNDERPRLPTTRLQVVLNLGDKRAAKLALPRTLDHPELDAEWDEETRSTAVSVDFARGQVHLDVSDDGIEHHFHTASGSATDRNPFSRSDADAVLTWALAFAADVHALMPGLEEDAGEAAAWHDEGYTIYVCETEPAQLDLLEIDIEGEILTLPWLGSGQVDQQHVEGDNHPIELLWHPTGEPDRPIARAWLDPRTEEPKCASIPGVDWTEVGLAEAEVLTWLEDIYLNHHVIEDPASAVFIAALERIAGIDGAERDEA
ncbi:hypothetical protein [Marisediminicola sp. LYQ134]|uniref:hypothetical protein n=1 Tax=unclassified Marisediminicola TaxID=2618316 RepID=UPI003983759F